MGKFIDKFKNIGGKIDSKANEYYQNQQSKPQEFNEHIKQKAPDNNSPEFYDDFKDDFMDDRFNPNFNQGRFNDFDNYGVGIQPAQKPESFHHFILENQYKDLEKSIRGYKDVYNKTTEKWEIKRKEVHCFTDEEAEDILRLTQSLLATDIKLSFINKDVFGIKMMLLYKRLKQLFRETAEYKYGRYSHDEKGNLREGGYAIEQFLKLQNLKIFVELTERISANYSRAIQGMENKLTHQSVQAQESLQSTDRNQDMNRRYT